MRKAFWVGLSVLVASMATAPPALAVEATAVEDGRTIRPLPSRPEIQQQGEQNLERKPMTVQPQRPPGLRAPPASEVVEIECPNELVYYALELDSTPALQGWQTQTVLPTTPRMRLRFNGVANLYTSSWQGASSIVCRYAGDGQGNDADYYTKLSRKVHASGTPYSCKVDSFHERKVECRLSITP